MEFRSAGGGDRRALAEINVTPLVDVMLVLLIIFMVAAPLISTGVKVDLPQVKSPAVETDAEKLVLAITRERRIYLADVEIPITQLADKLGTNARLKKDKELYLHADRSLSYGVVVEVMALARAAGIESIGMITDPPEVRR